MADDMESEMVDNMVDEMVDEMVDNIVDSPMDKMVLRAVELELKTYFIAILLADWRSSLKSRTSR